MLLKRRFLSSLRRRNTAPTEQENHKSETFNQQETDAHADKLLEGFIIPRLINRAQSPSHKKACHTLQINRLGNRYLYKIGEYEHLIPVEFLITDEILKTALKNAPGRGLSANRREVTFSMIIE